MCLFGRSKPFKKTLLIEHIFFYLGLSFLIIHEMDAIRCKEWRILPVISSLEEKTGEIVFLFAHIPLFVWVFWSLSTNTESELFMKGFDVFMIVHIGLHILFLKHKNNEFKDWISWFFIIGAGIFGAVHLFI